jgi:hypothetical protein
MNLYNVIFNVLRKHCYVMDSLKTFNFFNEKIMKKNIKYKIKY